MGLFSFLNGCKNSSTNAQQTIHFDNIILEDITSRIDKEEGWNDIFFKITSDTKTDTSHIYVAKGLFCSKIVGLQIEISSKIKAGIVNGQPDSKVGIARDAVQFKSLGQESDEFVKAIAELYKQTTDKGFTKRTISATAFSLNEKPVKLDEKDYYRLKLFFEENDANLYSELFLNINTKEQEIELHEKDVDYRATLIKVWTK